MNVGILPLQDNLWNQSRTARAAFFKNYVDNPNVVVPKPKSMIDDSMIESMKHIREVFRRYETFGSLSLPVIVINAPSFLPGIWTSSSLFSGKIPYSISPECGVLRRFLAVSLTLIISVQGLDGR